MPRRLRRGFFTYVEPVEHSADKYTRNAIIRNVHEKLLELMKHEQQQLNPRRFHRMTLIELLSDFDPSLSEGDTSIIVVGYVASQYKHLSDVPTEIIAAVGENAVKTSTFLETRRVVFQSDKILF